MKHVENSFLRIIQKYPDVNNFFNQFDLKDLFSPNWKLVLSCIKKMSDIPQCVLEINEEYNMCFMTKYLLFVTPVYFVDEYLKEFLRILQFLPKQDLDLLLQPICNRLTSDQKIKIIQQAPSSNATYELCGRFLLEPSLFLAAFQRIFSEFLDIPQSYRKQIIIYFSKALALKGQGIFLKDMLTFLSGKEVANEIIEVVLGAFLNTYPTSIENVPPSDIQSSFLKIIKIPHLSITMMKFLLINAQSTPPVVLNNRQCFYALQNYPKLFFQYITFLESDDQMRLWIFLLFTVSAFSFDQITSPIILHVYIQFYQESIKHPNFLSILNSEQVIDWFSTLLDNLDDDLYKLAAFGIFLLYLRTFESFASAINSKINFKNYLKYAYSHKCNIKSIADVVFWSFNYFSSYSNCPFEILCDDTSFLESTYLSIPPSSTFIFHISPVLLTTLLSTAVSASIPKNSPIISTPVRLFKQSENTHSQLVLNFEDPVLPYDPSSSPSQSDKNQHSPKTKSEGSESNESIENNEKSPKTDEIVESVHLVFPDEMETINAPHAPVGDLLEYVVDKLLLMYDDQRLYDFLYSLSNTQVLLPLIPFALDYSNSKCFKLIGRALGLSCPFSVFETFFDKIAANDLSKTLEFFKIIVENCSIVTDYLYISTPITLSVSNNCQSAVFWIRPVSHLPNQIIEIYGKSLIISLSLSTQYLEIYGSNLYKTITLPASIDGWYMITVCSISSNQMIITANLSSVKISSIDSLPWNKVIIGSENSHFNFQSGRFFAAHLTNDDLTYLFALGPGYIQGYKSDFIYVEGPEPTFVTSDGFISTLYLPFRNHYEFGKKIETNIFFSLEKFLAPPYRHFDKNSSNSMNNVIYNVSNPETISDNFSNLNLKNLNKSSESNLINQENETIRKDSNRKTKERASTLIISPSNKLRKKPVPKPKESSFVDRRRVYSFLNSLHCFGGLHLLIHYIGEVLLKRPELAGHIWTIMGSLFNRAPKVHTFFRQNHAYSLIGHLLWSGAAKAKDTIDLALRQTDNDYYIINPEIIKSWLLEAQIFYSDMDDIIVYLMRCIQNPHNFKILKSAQTFSKIIKLLSGPCYHTNEFLYLLGDFALLLTEPSTALEYSRLIFDRLMVCHFSFSSQDINNNNSSNNINNNNNNNNNYNNNYNNYNNSNNNCNNCNNNCNNSNNCKTNNNNNNKNSNERYRNQKTANSILTPQAYAISDQDLSKFFPNYENIQSSTTAALIRILRKILLEYPDVNMSLELFIPAIVTSDPTVQVSIITLLIQKMNYQYLLLLGRVLRSLPFLDTLADSIFAMLTSSPLDYSKLTTSLLYFTTHLLPEPVFPDPETQKDSKTQNDIKTQNDLKAQTDLKTQNDLKAENNLNSNSESQSTDINVKSIELNNNSIDYIKHICDLIELECAATAPIVIIALNQAVDIIASVDVYETQNNKYGRVFDLLLPFLTTILVKALSLNCISEFLRFFLALILIPNVPIHRLAIDTLRLLDSVVRQPSIQIEITAQTYIQQLTSDAIQRLRLTPGEFSPSIYDLLSRIIESLSRVLNPTLCVNFFIDLVQFELNPDLIIQIKKAIISKDKISKVKRYSELVERIEEPGSIPPSKYFAPFEIELNSLRSKWNEKEKTEYLALFSISCSSIHHQSCAAADLIFGDPDSDAIVDLWHKVFNTLQFPGSYIYAKCPVKWTVSDHSANYMERQVLHPLNPAIEKNYEAHWSVKYQEEPPKVRLHLAEVLKFTPLTLHLAEDVQFSAHAVQISGISSSDGVLICAGKKIRFYQKAENFATSFFCEEVLTINVSKVDHIVLKSYQHQPKGAEIVCTDFAVYFFAFDAANIRDLFIDVVTSYEIPIQRGINVKKLSETTKKWVDGSISSFDYLLFLNEFSGRSWTDFTQYPIMPWIIADYLSPSLSFTTNSKKTANNSITISNNLYISTANFSKSYNFSQSNHDSNDRNNNNNDINNDHSNEISNSDDNPFGDDDNKENQNNDAESNEYFSKSTNYSVRKSSDPENSQDLLSSPTLSRSNSFTRSNSLSNMRKELNGHFSSDSKDKDEKSNPFRDLSLPIFAQTKELRDQCSFYYKISADMGQEPHCTPNYISNVGSTLYFLLRLEPFSNNVIEFQGGAFDAIDRSFHSLAVSYHLMTSLANKSALELVPELYFMPEILENVNNIHLPDSPISSKKFGNVVLPPWCSSSRDFVSKMRLALELAPNLEEWIDLVWGIKRRSPDSYNVFQASVYEFDPSIAGEDQLLLKALVDQIQNCGQAAAPLFLKSPHPSRSFSPISRLIKGQLVQQPLKRLLRVPPYAYNPNQSLQFKHLINQSMKTPYEVIQLHNGIIKGLRGNQSVNLLSFADELTVTCFDITETILVTGHLLPIVNIWKLRNEAIHITSLRGHISHVTAVICYDPQWQLIAAGHTDGRVSLFSLNPMRYLRCLECPSHNPIIMLKTSTTTGDCLVVQQNGKGCSATLFTVNGMIITTFNTDSKILDATFTIFSDGIRENFVFLLLENQIVWMLSLLDATSLTSYQIEHPGPVSLILNSKDPLSLYVTHKDGQLTSWKIV